MGSNMFFFKPWVVFFFRLEDFFFGKYLWFQLKVVTFFPNSRMVLAQYRFWCVLGELGRFREGTWFQGPVPGSVSGKPGCGPEALLGVEKVASPKFRRFRCLMGSEGLGSVPEVWTEPVLGTGFREPEVLRRFRAKVPKVALYYGAIRVYFESMLSYVESMLLCFESIILYLKSALLYIESILLYVESMLLYFESMLLYFERMLLYFENIRVYFENIFCILNVYYFVLRKYTFVL